MVFIPSVFKALIKTLKLCLIYNLLGTLLMAQNEISDLNLREKSILIPLAIAVILIGILPNIFIDPMRLSLELIISNYEMANGK